MARLTMAQVLGMAVSPAVGSLILTFASARMDLAAAAELPGCASPHVICFYA